MVGRGAPRGCDLAHTAVAFIMSRGASVSEVTSRRQRAPARRPAARAARALTTLGGTQRASPGP
jgi:hypothetical protein